MNGSPARSNCWIRCRSSGRRSGFTLLELLVVVAVFSIMSAAAYSSLRSSLRAEENFDASMKELEAVQMSLAMFQRDIMQLSPRTIRDAFGDSEAAIVLFDGRELAFTRGGNFSSLRLDKSELARIAWSLQDEQLIRSTWRSLDSTQGEQPLRASLLTRVSRLQLRILDQNGLWHLDWPLAAGVMISAIEITLEVEDLGEIRRLLPLPG